MRVASRVAAVFLALLAAHPAAAQEEAFGHLRHSGLFPLCTGCHEMQGERAGFYPAAAQCAGCHDGTEQPRIDWTAPPARPSLLTFDHAAHAREASADAPGCEDCHVVPGQPRMEVEPGAVSATCLSCHAHEAPDHYASARCETCHQPLAGSALPLDRVLDLPAPPTHAATGFVSDHGAEESCAVCHTRERCTTCHVDAGVPGITRMPAAGPALELPVYAAHYPEPESHERRDWLTGHGAEAATPATCSTCHTRESCLTCHVAPAATAIAALPSAEAAQAPGVRTVRLRPASHAFPEFDQAHGIDAAAAGASCETCHARTACTDCHAEERAPAFHPSTFLDRHATAAFGRRLECANCHDAEVFCTECHRTAGLLPAGARAFAYHDAEPVWLLRHGQAARQALESCISCHRQPDCLQCHSQLGAFRVNPHGPDFDPERAARRNSLVCRTCHLRDPIGGRP